MIAALLAVPALIVATVLLLFWIRERKLLALERGETERLRASVGALETRFRNVLDPEAELRRIADEHAALRAQCESEEANRREQTAAFDAELLRRREENDRALAAEQARVARQRESDDAKRREQTAAFDAELLRRREENDRALAAEQARVSSAVADSQAQMLARRTEWEKQFSEAVLSLERLHGEVEGLNEEAEIQSFGLYKPRFSFATAEEFKSRLEDVRERQKTMVKEKTAAICRTKWTVGGSTVEGRRMVDQQLKLMLRAFNGECDAIVASVSWKNVVTLQQRMRKIFEAVNKLGESSMCELTHAYAALKEEELQLAHEHVEKVHEEREEQRQLREQMREEERANREIERDREDAERDEEKYQSALDRVRIEVASANEKERASLDAKIKKLEAMLEKAEERRKRAVSQAELTRSGYVYILSNQGTFGANVFKIGMTRRLDPMDRVLELGGAPVPFHFDVHALIYSDDAPGLESKLHAALEPHRVNLVNSRKEFFRVPLEKIVDLVTNHHGQIRFNEEVDAPDYRKTLAIRAEREAMVAGRQVQASAVKRVDEIRARFEELKKATA